MLKSINLTTLYLILSYNQKLNIVCTLYTQASSYMSESFVSLLPFGQKLPWSDQVQSVDHVNTCILSCIDIIDSTLYAITVTHHK